MLAIFPARESWVSDIPAWNEKTASVFTVYRNDFYIFNMKILVPYCSFSNVYHEKPSPGRNLSDKT
jgi:hypothetical protein